MQLHRFFTGLRSVQITARLLFFLLFFFALWSLAGIISAPPINTNVWAQTYTVWLVTLSSHSDKMLIRKKSKSEPNYYSQSQSSCFIRGFHHCSCWGTDKPLQLAESSLQAREQPRKAYDVQGLHMLKIKKQINPCKLSQNMLFKNQSSVKYSEDTLCLYYGNCCSGVGSVLTHIPLWEVNNRLINASIIKTALLSWLAWYWAKSVPPAWAELSIEEPASCNKMLLEVRLAGVLFPVKWNGLCFPSVYRSSWF